MENIISFSDPVRTGDIALTADLFDFVHYVITHNVNDILDKYPYEVVNRIILNYVWQGNYTPVNLNVINNDNMKDLSLHMVNTAIYSCMLAERMGEDVYSACAAGLLHDIGKKYIPQDILFRPGKLTESEWELIHMHPLASKILLTELYPEFADDVFEAVLCHHERMDGRGYPLKMPKHNLGVLSRMIAIADTVDASMAKNRSYHKAKSVTEVILIIKDKYHYDASLVDVMIDVLQVLYPEILMESV